jgi:hypothetical protein
VADRLPTTDDGGGAEQKWYEAREI